MNSHYTKLLICGLFGLSNFAHAGFNFCQDNNTGNDGGSDTFLQQISLNEIVEIGELPKGISGIEVKLNSTVDIDIQLYDKETGEAIIGWPDGILAHSNYQSHVYHGTLVEWSGYNGDGTGLGNEYIKISNADDPSAPTNRSFIMKAFGYKAGLADVNYSWSAANCNTSESGNNSFQQSIMQNATVKVGDIPVDVQNLYIKLDSNNDVDIQLYDADSGTAIVAWPNGLLNKASKESVNSKGMLVEWSGYNGTDNKPGNEYIKITGHTTRNLTMKLFGYRSGEATVNYSWGSNENDDDNPENSIENEMKVEFLSLVNQARSQGRNCGDTFYPAVNAITWNSKLYQAALDHSEDMADNNYFSHIDQDGNGPGHRITAAGYSWGTYGENIAAGYSTAQKTMTGWLNSPGHCKNIMKSTVTNFGVASALGGSYGIYWTQVFARPK